MTLAPNKCLSLKLTLGYFKLLGVPFNKQAFADRNLKTVNPEADEQYYTPDFNYVSAFKWWLRFKYHNFGVSRGTPTLQIIWVQSLRSDLIWHSQQPCDAKDISVVGAKFTRQMNEVDCWGGWSPEWMCVVWHGHCQVKDQCLSPRGGKAFHCGSQITKPSLGPSVIVDNEWRKHPSYLSSPRMFMACRTAPTEIAKCAFLFICNNLPSLFRCMR